MTCFMFPGQPVAFTALPAQDTTFHGVAQLCQVTTGFNPLDEDHSTQQLSESVRLQLFGTCMSLYRSNLLIRELGPPDMITEHSMGIYAALAACDSIDNATALELTCRIGSCLSAMGVRRSYALGSVVGLGCEALTAIAANNDVYIANYNTSRHHLLSGEREKISAATTEAMAAGAFSVGLFPCDAPLHTPLVNEVIAELHAIVAEYSFLEPRIPLLNHLDQKQLHGADIADFLVEELCRPVFWEQSYRALQQAGIRRFIEVGAGTALTKFNRWIDTEL